MEIWSLAEIKQDFFQAVAILQYCCTIWIQTERMDKKKKKSMRPTQDCYVLFWINTGSNKPQNSNCTATYLQSYKPSKLDEQDILGITGEVKTNS